MIHRLPDSATHKITGRSFESKLSCCHEAVTIIQQKVTLNKQLLQENVFFGSFGTFLFSATMFRCRQLYQDVFEINT